MLIGNYSGDVGVWISEFQTFGSRYFRFLVARTVGNAGITRSNTPLQTGQWYHVTWTKAAGSTGTLADKYTVYINGSIEGQTLIANQINNWQTTNYNPGTNWFTTAQDTGGFGTHSNSCQFAFFNKELSAAEVSEIYNGGVTIDYQTTSVGSNLLWYVPVDVNDGPGSNTVIERIAGNNGTTTNMTAANFQTLVP